LVRRQKERVAPARRSIPTRQVSACPQRHNAQASLSSGTPGGRHAPNHPADPLRGTSRHHYLGGGLDERPTLKLIPTTHNNDRGGKFSGPLVTAHSTQQGFLCTAPIGSFGVHF
jgi:hypothetical protein